MNRINELDCAIFKTQTWDEEVECDLHTGNSLNNVGHECAEVAADVFQGV